MPAIANCPNRVECDYALMQLLSIYNVPDFETMPDTIQAMLKKQIGIWHYVVANMRKQPFGWDYKVDKLNVVCGNLERIRDYAMALTGICPVADCGPIDYGPLFDKAIAIINSAYLWQSLPESEKKAPIVSEKWKETWAERLANSLWIAG